MANAFVVYPAYSLPDYVISQNIDKVSQVESYWKYERDRTKEREKDKNKTTFSKILEKEKKRDKRWETGDVSNYSEIGDPGFFFDCKM